MKVLSVVTFLAITVMTSGSVLAGNYTGSHPRTTSITFRLHVTTQPSSNLTYWVAYGPLNGKFGLVRLHASASGLYSGSEKLPVQGRTVFAYLAGNGVLRTRVGEVPGDPVITIKRVGPVSLAARHLPVLNWQGPAG